MTLLGTAGGAPVAKTSHDVLSKAPETPSAGAPAPAKSAAQPVEKPKPKPVAKETKKAPADPATTPEQESDIALPRTQLLISLRIISMSQTLTSTKSRRSRRC